MKCEKRVKMCVYAIWLVHLIDGMPIEHEIVGKHTVYYTNWQNALFYGKFNQSPVVYPFEHSQPLRSSLSHQQSHRLSLTEQQRRMRPRMYFTRMMCCVLYMFTAKTKYSMNKRSVENCTWNSKDVFLRVSFRSNEITFQNKFCWNS